MTGKILNSLLDSGFFPENQGVSVRIYGRKYSVTEEKGTIYITSVHPVRNPDSKVRHMDAVEAIAGRYGITSAGFRGDNLFVVLSKPSSNTGEEARRIKFLIQSLNRITDNEIHREEESIIKEREANSLKNKEVEKAASGLDAKSERDIRENAEKDKERGTDNIRTDNLKETLKNPPMDLKPIAVINERDEKLLPETLVPEKDKDNLIQRKKKKFLESKGKGSLTEDTKNTINPSADESEKSDIYRATAKKGSQTYSAYGYTKDREGRKLKDSYISNDDLSPEETMMMERENNLDDIYREIPYGKGLTEVKGIVGIVLGVVISLIILGLMYKAYILSDYFAFIMGIIVYFGYRNLTAKSPANLKAAVPALIAGAFVLTVIMNVIEIRDLTRSAGSQDISTVRSVLMGIEAFINNRKYVVSSSWSSFIIAVFSSLTGFLICWAFTEKNQVKREETEKKI